jgi:hypothetical protein
LSCDGRSAQFDEFLRYRNDSLISISSGTKEREHGKENKDVNNKKQKPEWKRRRRSKIRP